MMYASSTLLLLLSFCRCRKRNLTDAQWPLPVASTRAMPSSTTPAPFRMSMVSRWRSNAARRRACLPAFVPQQPSIPSTSTSSRTTSECPFWAATSSGTPLTYPSRCIPWF
ncbi:unnamed protein product, partial [Ectocarpus sp. 6 AP-2014]